MLTPYDLRSTVGLYHYTRWVQNCVTLLRPHLRPESLTPDTLLTLCECACAARNHCSAGIGVTVNLDAPPGIIDHALDHVEADSRALSVAVQAAKQLKSRSYLFTAKHCQK